MHLKRIFPRRRSRGCPPEVLDGLIQLAMDPEIQPARRYVDDMILFASVNKNAHKLDMGYVDRTRESALELVKTCKVFGRA